MEIVNNEDTFVPNICLANQNITVKCENTDLSPDFIHLTQMSSVDLFCHIHAVFIAG